MLISWQSDSTNRSAPFCLKCPRGYVRPVAVDVFAQSLHLQNWILLFKASRWDPHLNLAIRPLAYWCRHGSARLKVSNKTQIDHPDALRFRSCVHFCKSFLVCHSIRWLRHYRQQSLDLFKMRKPVETKKQHFSDKPQPYHLRWVQKVILPNL